MTAIVLLIVSISAVTFGAIRWLTRSENQDASNPGDTGKPFSGRGPPSGF